MTFAPRTLLDLAAYWQRQGGVNLGIVGNQAHVCGYHLGRDRIYGPGGLGDNDYSVQLPRDKAGLSDAASAIDLGRLDGSLDNLYAFARDLVARCMADHTTYRDIREVIYSPDGEHVQRYSGVDHEIHTGPGNGDASHLGHVHISYHRDSVGRDKVAHFAPYFAEDSMPAAVNGGGRVIASDYVRDVKAGTVLYRDTTGARLTTMQRDGTLDDTGVPVGVSGWAYVLVRSAGFDADSEIEAGQALVKVGDVGPLRRKTPAELANTAARYVPPADCAAAIATAIAADRAKAHVSWEE